MDAPDSKWIATAGSIPFEMGAAMVRMAALRLSNMQFDADIELPTALINQSFLIENSVYSLKGLQQAMPALQYNDFETACWIPRL